MNEIIKSGQRVRAGPGMYPSKTSGKPFKDFPQLLLLGQKHAAWYRRLQRKADYLVEHESTKEKESNGKTSSPVMQEMLRSLDAASECSLLVGILFMVFTAIPFVFFIHEIGHILMARQLGYKVTKLGLTLYKLDEYKGALNEETAFFLSKLAGPLANILVGTVILVVTELLVVSQYPVLILAFIVFYSLPNLLLGILHFLPLKDSRCLTDGQVICNYIFCRKSKKRKARLMDELKKEGKKKASGSGSSSSPVTTPTGRGGMTTIVHCFLPYRDFIRIIKESIPVEELKWEVVEVSLNFVNSTANQLMEYLVNLWKMFNRWLNGLRVRSIQVEVFGAVVEGQESDKTAGIADRSGRPVGALVVSSSSPIKDLNDPVWQAYELRLKDAGDVILRSDGDKGFKHQILRSAQDDESGDVKTQVIPLSRHQSPVTVPPVARAGEVSQDRPLIITNEKHITRDLEGLTADPNKAPPGKVISISAASKKPPVNPANEKKSSRVPEILVLLPKIADDYFILAT
ncbi:MAG: hypothetical protein KAS66_16465, partial [Candidatus Omnitrophica bacterium]|nr:hypothetical protein [Candidatus Omnitrophota bacterium]